MPRPVVAPPGKPDLRNVVPEDLTDTGRLLELYEQAVAAGLVPPSEWGRLRFVAAAEHARSIGKDNPCGLFVRLVRGGLLHFATADDETEASRRIRQHEYGLSPVPPAVEQEPVIRRRPELSDDARLVQAIRIAASRAGYRGDPFPLLKREKPEWNRERWDRAAEELDGFHRGGSEPRSWSSVGSGCLASTRLQIADGFARGRRVVSSERWLEAASANCRRAHQRAQGGLLNRSFEASSANCRRADQRAHGGLLNRSFEAVSANCRRARQRAQGGLLNRSFEAVSANCREAGQRARSGPLR